MKPSRNPLDALVALRRAGERGSAAAGPTDNTEATAAGAAAAAPHVPRPWGAPDKRGLARDVGKRGVLPFGSLLPLVFGADAAGAADAPAKRRRVDADDSSSDSESSSSDSDSDGSASGSEDSDGDAAPAPAPAAPVMAVSASTAGADRAAAELAASWGLHPTLVSALTAPSAAAASGESDGAPSRLRVTRFFPIQRAVVPAVVRAQQPGLLAAATGVALPGDVCMLAPTGSGKTLAYLLPTISALLAPDCLVPRLRALVLVPTRDLAKQVAAVAQGLLDGVAEAAAALPPADRPRPLRVFVATGQQSQQAERAVLRWSGGIDAGWALRLRAAPSHIGAAAEAEASARSSGAAASAAMDDPANYLPHRHGFAETNSDGTGGGVGEETALCVPDIVIATPGRLVDHLAATPGFTLQYLRFLIIDEADRLLSERFSDWPQRLQAAIAPHGTDPTRAYSAALIDRTPVTAAPGTADAALEVGVGAGAVSDGAATARKRRKSSAAPAATPVSSAAPATSALDAAEAAVVARIVAMGDGGEAGAGAGGRATPSTGKRGRKGAAAVADRGGGTDGDGDVRMAGTPADGTARLSASLDALLGPAIVPPSHPTPTITRQFARLLAAAGPGGAAEGSSGAALPSDPLGMCGIIDALQAPLWRAARPEGNRVGFISVAAPLPLAAPHGSAASGDAVYGPLVADWRATFHSEPPTWLVEAERTRAAEARGAPPGVLVMPAPPLTRIVCSATLTSNPRKLASLHLRSPTQFVATEDVVGDEEGDAAADGPLSAVATAPHGAAVAAADMAQAGAGGEDRRKYTLPASLRQAYVVCGAAEKAVLLVHILRLLQRELGVDGSGAADGSGAVARPSMLTALVFVASVEMVGRLAQLLRLYGGVAGKIVELSSLAGQAARDRVLTAATRGEVSVVVTTDLGGRGIDLPHLPAVIHYDVAARAKTYVHRVGRTARAGSAGVTYTLLRHDQVRHFKLEVLLRCTGGAGAPRRETAMMATVEAYMPRMAAVLPRVQATLDAAEARKASRSISLLTAPADREDGDEVAVPEAGELPPLPDLAVLR